MCCFYDIFKRYLGLHQVPVGTETVGARLVIRLAKGSQHDNLRVLELIGITQDIEHLEAANARHHDVGNDQIRLFGFGYDQRLLPVLGGDDCIPLGL